MRRAPVSVVGIPVGFVGFAVAVWGASRQNDNAPTVIVALGLLAICTVWTSISVLRHGRVYRWLRPERRPRRWVVIALLQLFTVFSVWFPVLISWPQAFISRLLLLFFAIDFFVTGMTVKWFTPAIDRLVQRRGWQLR